MTFRIDASNIGGAEARKAENLMARVAELRKARQAQEPQESKAAGEPEPSKPINADNPNEVAAFLDRLPDAVEDGQDHHQLSAAKVAALLDLV